MKNFFTEMVAGKNKKKLMVISLFLVAVFLFLPSNLVNAGLLDDPAGTIGSALSGWFFTVAAVALKFILAVASVCVYVAAYLVDCMLDPNLYKAVLSSDTGPVAAGWTTIRDFCNMFYVFFLLLIAFATITRWQAYSAKNLLPKIILSVFLINFSATLTKVVIDFGQVFLFGMAGWMGSFSGTNGKAAGLTAVVGYFSSQLNSTTDVGSDTLIRFIFAIMYTMTLALMYVLMAGLLLARLVTFVILICVSPAAFFSIAMPSLNSIKTRWWKALFKNTISGPVFIFFVYLSAVMASDLMNYTQFPATGDNLSFLNGMATLLARYGIALAMLWAAIPASQEIGGFGATAIMGGFAGTGGAAMYYYNNLKVGRKALSVPLGRAHAYAKEKSTRYNDGVKWANSKLEQAPIGGRAYIKHESDNKEKISQDVAEHKKILSTLTTEQMAAYADSFKLNVEQGARAKQAMMQVLAEKGKLTNDELMKAGYKKNDALDKTKFMSDMNTIKSYGGDPTDVYKQRMDLVGGKNQEETAKNIAAEINKAVDRNELGKVKMDVMLDEATMSQMKAIVPQDKLDKWMSGKNQGEKDSYLGQKEKMLVRDINKANVSALSEKDKGKVKDFQTEAAILSRVKQKEEKAKGLTGINIKEGKFELKGDVDETIIKEAISRTSKEDKLGFDKEFMMKHGHDFSFEDYKHVAQRGTGEQKDAILTSYKQRNEKLQQELSHVTDQQKKNEIEKELGRLKDIDGKLTKMT